MESPAHRRLRSIVCHLLPSEMDTGGTILLRQRCLSSDWLDSPPPVIIGGMVLDVQARPYAATRPGTTTPGEIKYVNGGVARNVAECMAKLGVRPFMISVVGNDMAGNILLENWVSCELSMQGIQKLQNGNTPVVLNIFDASGELAAGVASIEAVEKHLSPDWIQHFRQNISFAPIVMVDANLHPRSLESACRIAAENNVPVWFEPVSITKSKRVASVAKYLTFASPNEEELIAMANSLSYGNELYSYVNVENHEGKESIVYKMRSLKPAIRFLLDKGIKVIVLTLGSDGVLVCSKDQSVFRENLKHTKYDFLGRAERHLYDLMNNSCHSYGFNDSLKLAKYHSHSCALHFPALSASVVSLIGAGDCLVGGMLASLCSGLDFMQSVAVAISTAKAAVESEVNVPSQISISKVADEAKEIFRFEMKAGLFSTLKEVVERLVSSDSKRVTIMEQLRYHRYGSGYFGHPNAVSSREQEIEILLSGCDKPQNISNIEHLLLERYLRLLLLEVVKEIGTFSISFKKKEHVVLNN